jgi:hypothetical protein
MSVSDPGLAHVCAELDSTASAIAQGTAPVPPVAEVRRAVVAAVHLYTAYAQSTGDHFPPVDEEISSTEAVLLATALLKARDLNPFDLALWFNRVS